MDLLADTTFLIDLWREQRQTGPATTFAQRNANLSVGIPWVVSAEFLGGGVLAGHDMDALAVFLDPYPVVHSTEAIIRHCAVLYGEIRRYRLAVGPNDLWIAACARALEMPLVTRNVRDFAQLSGVRTLSYSGTGEVEAG